ncbi:MAG: mannose-1-phosphate guanylyltransferase [Thermogutta sp.]
MLYAVILAGGSGTRLWPESRSAKPKQLLSICGSESLLRATVNRIARLVPFENIIVATSRDLAPLVQEELSFLPREALLVEPAPRNTAPCIGLAALRLIQQDPDAVMAVMPADHVIEPPEAFLADLQLAVEVVEDDPSRLVTFGIVPNYPSSSFGYIQRGDPLAIRGPLSGGAEATIKAESPRVFQAKGFREKPSVTVAEEYMRDGHFFWNAGIFVWKSQTIWELLRRYRPAVAEPLSRIFDSVQNPHFAEILESQFCQTEKISIDYAVMEKAENVVVIQAQFRWDDVGSWRALERLFPLDADNNVADAEKCILLDTKGCIIRCRDSQHLIATLGVEDLVVVITPDATLVAHKSREEDVRKILEKIVESGWREYL